MLLNVEGIAADAFTRTPTQKQRFLAIGEQVIDVDTLRLVGAADGVRLTPKAMGVLLHLVASAGRTCSRDDLLNEVWKGTCPTPDVLTQAVKDLRRALGDHPQQPRYVETLPRLGYRLVAPARYLDAAPATADDAAADPTPTSAATAGAGPTVQRIRRAGLALAASALLALALLAATYLTRSGPGDAAPRWQASSLRVVTADPGPENFPHVSPDGTRVAYTIGDAQMHNRRIVQRALTPSRVVGLSEAASGDEFYPAWSPDGALIAFARFADKQCRLVVVPALGGPERDLGACRSGVLDYFSWAPDAKHLITTTPSALAAADTAIRLLPLDGAAPQPLNYARAASDIDLDARYSPDGRHIAFRRGTNPYSDLYVMDADGSHVRRLTQLASRLRGYDWTRDGSALVFSSGHSGVQALYVVSLADGRIDALGVQPAEFPSAARQADTVVYEIPRQRTQLAVVALDAGASARDLAPSTGSDAAPVPAPDDDRVLFVSDRGGAQQLWLHDPASDETFALTEAGDPTLHYPAWRPDGARALVTTRGEAGGHLVEIDLATRARRVLSRPDEDVLRGIYGTRADSWIALVGDGGQGRALVELVAGDGEHAARRVLAHDVERFDRDPVGGALYFTRSGRPELFRLDPVSGGEQVVAAHPALVGAGGWHVLDGRVFHLDLQANGSGELRAFDPVRGDDELVVTLADWLPDLDFALTRDRHHIVVARAARVDTDVGALTLRRL
jgi:Tol biopolymer transport system component/DNA-binding winged helix-turn-helix (wHTH) protein